MNRTVLLLFIFFLPFMAKVHAQPNKFTADADKDFQEFRYYDAIDKYKKAYSKIKKDKAEKARMKFMTAECYRKVNDSKQAEEWYDKCIKINYPDPIIYFYYAEMLRTNGKYEEAIIQYNLYKEKVPGDPKPELGLKSAQQAGKWKENPSRFEVENEKRFNSKDKDFCPTYADNKYKSVYFSSSRESSMGKKTDSWTGQSFMDLYYSSQDKKNAWSTPEILPAPINTEANEGCACLNDKGTTMYFTRCPVEKNVKNKCQIYVTEKKGKEWSTPELIKLGPDSFTYGHPSISEDELELYFASDLPNDHGGRDIWVVKRLNKKSPWGKPENLGSPINTSGDELYPFIRKDSTLYFASNGLIGMGGLDIYKSKKIGNRWSEPENMLSPINSPADDFGIVFEGRDDKGFFTSNREGNAGDEGSKGKGDDDIWRFYLPPLIFTLQGAIIDDSTKEPLNGVIIHLVRNDGAVAIDTTDKKGFYKFEKQVILPNSTFNLTFTKEDFFTKKGQETTVGLERSKALVYDESLAKVPDKPIELPEILYDLGRWELKPEYQGRLDGLIKIMNENPKFVIELSSHTDSRPIPMTNMVLSQKRAESVVEYMTSKGIAGDRMIPKGYGETKPKVLIQDAVRDGIKFSKGTILTDDYINSLKTVKEREAAHQLNRRTEFKVVRKDYVPKGGNIEAPKIELISNNPENNTETKVQEDTKDQADKKDQPKEDKKMKKEKKKKEK